MGTLRDGQGITQQNPEIDYSIIQEHLIQALGKSPPLSKPSEIDYNIMQEQLMQVLGKTPVHPIKRKRLPVPVEKPKKRWWQFL